MIEALFSIAVSIGTVIAFSLLWGEDKRNLGKIKKENQHAEEKLNSISKGIEKLLGPRPNRAVLIKHWKRRLREATEGDDSTTLPGPESGSDRSSE
jgi:hypothetical protein